MQSPKMTARATPFSAETLRPPIVRRSPGQVKLTVSSTHASQHRARRAYVRIARFLTELRQSVEQLDALQRWCRILSEGLRSFLKGRQLDPPRRLNPA